jgi:aspartyl-tRNA(Asn)/glutamyl-tRNA(Gln) amidotransferase subunit C
MSRKKFTKDEIQHLADLSMLNLSSEELSKIPDQLTTVLNYTEVLSEADVSNTEETDQVTSLDTVLAEDNVHDSLSQDDALSNAKETQDGYFKVPKVF